MGLCPLREQDKNIIPTFSFEIDEYNVKIILDDKYCHKDDEELLGYSSRRNLYYHVINENNTLASYAVIVAEEKEALVFDVRDYSLDQVLVVHFEGYTGTYRIIDFKR